MTFLSRVWSVLVGVKDALVLLLLLLFFMGLWALTSFTAPQVNIPAGAALRLNLDGILVDEARDISPMAVLSGSPIVQEMEVRDVVRAVDRARIDGDISSIVLDLDGFIGGGQANLEAVGDALTRFRAADKKVYSFATAYVDSGYYLAAHSDKVWMAPEGAVLLSGPGGSGLYFKELLDELKVNVEVFRVGTYKSFVEPFTRNDRSPESRLADQEIADDLWGLYRARVEREREGLELDSLIQSMSQRVSGANRNLSQLALDWKLVDEIGGRLAFQESMRTLVGGGQDADKPGAFAHVDMADYLTSRVRTATQSGPAVAVIHIAGPIIDGSSPAGEAGAEDIAALIGKAVADSDVKAIVLRIDSGGGSVTAGERIREAVADAHSRGKPIVASFGPVAASAAYWLATPADAIFASSSTVTGSIGVFGILPTLEKTLGSIGVHADRLTTTPYSGQPDILGGLNDPVRTLLQSSVESTYQRFVALVAGARKLPVTDVEKIAEGRVWSGKQARELRLIDGFGGLDVAVADAARRAGITEADPRVKVIRRDRPFFLQFLAPYPDSAARSAVAGQDAFARLVFASRLGAISQVQTAVTVANGPALQAHCFQCAPYQPARVQRHGEGQSLPFDRLGAVLRRVAGN